MATLVVKKVGSAGGGSRDYSTPQLCEDAKPANMVTADELWRMECYTDSLFNVAGTVLTVAGSTTDATRHLEITAAAGQSLCDQPAASTALAAQSYTLGVAFQNTSAYVPTVNIQENYTRLSRIQSASTASSGRPIEVGTSTTGVVVENCIFYNSNGGQTRIEGTSTQVVNCLFQFIGSTAQIRTTGTVTFLNCAFIGNGTAAAGFNSTYFIGTIKNCYVGGFTADIDVTSGNTRTNNATSDSTPSGGFTGSIPVNTTTFVSIVGPDYRLPTGSALIGAGTATGAPATDFFGTARGASVDIGPFQTASAPAGYTLTAAQGSYALTGQALGLKTAKRIVAAQGSYALTGQSVAAKVAHKLIAAQGSYVYTGQSVSIKTLLRLSAAQGVYTYTGQSVSLRKTYTAFFAEQGAYSVTGQSVAIFKTGGFALGQGTYTLTGQAANIVQQRRLTAAQGSYALTGQASNAVKAWRLAADAGIYAVTGQDASLRKTALRLAVEQGTYTLAGQSVGLDYAASGKITAETGSYVLTGQLAGLRMARALVASQGSYALTGQDITLDKARKFGLEAGTYALDGQGAGFVREMRLAAESGTYTLSGKPILMVYSAVGGPGATPEDIWGYVLTNGKTAGQNLSEINSMLTGPIDGIVGLNQALQVLLAVAAGRSHITDLGNGTARVEFEKIGGGDIRVGADMNGSERTNVDLTL